MGERSVSVTDVLPDTCCTAVWFIKKVVLALVLFTNNGCVQVNRGDIACVFPRDSSTPGYAGARSCSVVTAALSSS